MTAAFRENWKRLSDKGISRYNTGDDNDIVRFKDQHLLTTNASGLNGIVITGIPIEGDGLIFRDGQWVIALTNASGINGISIVGVPTEGDGLILRNGVWVTALTNASGINGIAVVGVPTEGDGLILRDGQWVAALTNASGINGIAIVGTPTEADGLILRDGIWVTALTNASGINGIAVIGSPSIDDVLKFDGTNWAPAVDASGTGGVPFSREVEANSGTSASPNLITALESNKVFTNEGVSEKNFHTLPSAETGLTYTFINVNAFGMRVTAATGDTIRIGVTKTATGGFVDSMFLGDILVLVAINNTEWVSLLPLDGWTFDI